jgi:hypothetical protein
MRKKRQPEVKTVNLFEFLGESLIGKLEEQPITVEFLFADGSRTVEITKKDRSYKQLNEQRQQRIAALRSSLRVALQKK